MQIMHTRLNAQINATRIQYSIIDVLGKLFSFEKAGISKPASRQKITQSPETKQTLLLGSSSKALFNFALRELLSITQAKFLCKRLFRVLLKSFP